jgi:hypothetical protein
VLKVPIELPEAFGAVDAAGWKGWDVVVGTWLMVWYTFEPVRVPFEFKKIIRHFSPDIGSAYSWRRNRVPLLERSSSALFGSRFKVR